jgi:uncharacterized protein (TIGR02145 family)
MPIHIGTSTKNQQQISLAATQMQKVYVGDKLVWSKGTPLANSKYGLHYNWYAATDAKGFVSGWRVPTYTDFDNLMTYINNQGYTGLQGKVLKEIGDTYWYPTPNVSTNIYGFNWRGAGFRNNTGAFGNIGINGQFWSSTAYDSSNGMIFQTSRTIDSAVITYDAKKYGRSLRLLKNDSTDPGFVDIDGKRYNTVKIGNQVWLSENLKAIHFADGTTISEVTGNSAWAALTTPGLCAYGNDWSNV